MPKLPPLSGRDVVEILKGHGFSKVRQKGSHIVMQKLMDTTTITVPVPNHKDLRTGTLLPIIRQSQIPRTAFENKDPR